MEGMVGLGGVRVGFGGGGNEVDWAAWRYK
jgi:hypothetical protein